MEARLNKLLDSNSECNRVEIALEWKQQGKKVIGVLCPYVPEEIIYAAGMLPWRVTGTWQASTPLASVYRPENTCLYCSHVLESLLSGQLDFLDGVISTDYDDDRRRLWDVWVHVKKPQFAHIMHAPRIDSPLAIEDFASSLRKLIAQLEQFGGTKISDDAIRKAAKSYNLTRRLLGTVYEWRKRDVPPLSGAETLKLTTAASIMPKDQFNTELESLLGYLDQRKTSVSQLQPRVLVASDALDHPGFLELVEESGSLVAMDDTDTGSRSVYCAVETEDEVVRAIATRYITRPPCPRMFFWAEKGVDQLIQWVKDYRIDGVLNLVQMYGYPRWYSSPYLADKLTAAGIPNQTIVRDYHLGSVGQLRTRIEAFVEMLC